MNREKSSYAVQSVENALDILETLADETHDGTLPFLAGKLGISRNKTFRLLATLEGRGLVEKDDWSGNYHLGVSTVELAQRFLRNISLIKHAHPVVESLARKHHEAVYMTVLRGSEVLFLDMVDCDQQIKAESFAGKRFPFFTNAAGKAIKAMESQDMLEKYFHHRRKEVAGQAELESELELIREKGVAVDIGGLGDGIVSVAVAVRDYAGKVVGAIAMLGPSFRMAAGRLENEIIPSLREGAEMLSMKFGYARI
ncbi:IclR family transcriptional regulator [Geotalea sp. SG265]|uniref:IclR family transcriptional regulator n=1 Tax=Geotalea sp. SG265 TaxID=2922867 RepID=UPI001FAF4D8A|nr:IclR family transcriptional regulator [Geotalea sp. SG265]